MLDRSELNSIESKISQPLINNEFTHEDFTTIINEEKNYCELRKIFRLMKTQRSDTGKNNFTEEDKWKGIDEIIRQNAKVKNNVALLFKVEKKYRKHKPKNFRNQ